MVSKKTKTKTSLALSSAVSPSVADMEQKLTKPYREVLENWEHDYVEKANERWKENHRNFIKELMFQQDLYDSYKNIKTRRVNNIKELSGNSLVVNNKLSAIEETGTAVGVGGHPVEYYVARDSTIPIKKVVTYYGLVDEDFTGSAAYLTDQAGVRGTTTYLTNELVGAKDGIVTLVPSNDDYTYLDLKSPSFTKTGGAITLTGSSSFQNTGLVGRNDDVYEVVEESLIGDTDPFGIAKQRKIVRDGVHAKEQQSVDLVIKDGSSYYPLSSNKVSALDLAGARGLSREALRNRINKRTGQQQISYLYEGYNNNEGNYLPGTYGSFLPEGYEFVVRQGDQFPSRNSVKFLDLDTFKGSRFSNSGDKELRALPSPTSSSLLAGTTLDGARPKRKNRFRSELSKDVSLEKVEDTDYTYLHHLNNYPSESKSGGKLPKKQWVGSDLTKPFGLDVADLEEADYFQTVAVDLRRHKLSDRGNVQYPKIVLPKKVFMDDVGGRRGWVAVGDNAKRYQLNRSSSLQNFLDNTARGSVRYTNVPGMATHMAGAVVNDALDRLFGYGAEDPRLVGLYLKRENASPPPPPVTAPPRPSRHYGLESAGDAARRKMKELQEEWEKEERDRERRKKERDADRQLQLRKLDDDYEKEKRDREARQNDRKRERELEKKRREMEWEQQQAEWDRQKRQRDAEREKLRQERERLEEEARLKAKQKFDPRVHTVLTEDIPPETDDGSRAHPIEVVEPAPKPQLAPVPVAPQRKKMLAEEAEHDPGEVKGEEMGHWKGHGFFKDERVIFNSDQGSIYWTKPKGSLEVIFKSPEGHLEFSAKVEPKHEGMKIYEVREDAEVLISNGRGPESLETLEFTAIDGVVVIVLETYEEEDQLPPEYKMVWSLHV